MLDTPLWWVRSGGSGRKGKPGGVADLSASRSRNVAVRGPLEWRGPQRPHALNEPPANGPSSPAAVGRP